MRRSEINSILADAVGFFETMKIALPKFAFYRIDDWRQQKRTVREILDLHLGWDITDFGAGDFSKTGLLLFTLRNGKVRSRFY
ncbi:MAG TPA: D-lyxose/D-mannose family sugar isomerase, partial [Bacteroidota bacterium]|nr:D-lyxose/D-mannose family sugar isomerase [Bacteroidota bacterium]